MRVERCENHRPALPTVFRYINRQLTSSQINNGYNDLRDSTIVCVFLKSVPVYSFAFNLVIAVRDLIVDDLDL